MSDYNWMVLPGKIMLWVFGIIMVISILIACSDPKFETRDMKLMRISTELKEQKIRVLQQMEKGCTCFKNRKDKP